MDYKYCVDCGERLPRNAKFCVKCGAKQPALNNESHETIEQRTSIQNSDAIDRTSQRQSLSSASLSQSNSEASSNSYQSLNSSQEEYRDSRNFGNDQSHAYKEDSFANNQQRPYNESREPNLWNSFNIWVKNWNKPNVCMGRADFWWGSLAIGIVISLLAFIEIIAIDIDEILLGPFVVFTVFLVSIVLGVWEIIAIIERLHDTGRSGWYYCLGFIPIVGGIIVLVLCCQPTNRNQHTWPRP